MGTALQLIVGGRIMNNPRITQTGENRVANFNVELLRDTARGTQTLVFQVAAWNDLADAISEAAQPDNGIIFTADWLRPSVYNNTPQLGLDVSSIITITEDVCAMFMQLHATGNVSSDIRANTTGQNRVANFNVAHNRGKDPNRETVFMRFAAWNAQSDVVQNYVRKGDPIHVVTDWIVPGIYNNQVTLQSDANRIVLLGRGNGSAAAGEASAPTDIPF